MINTLLGFVLSHLKIDTESFSYHVVFSAKRRSIALQVRQGHLVVRAPLATNLADIKRVVAEQRLWVVKHLQQSKVLVNKPDYLELGLLPLQNVKLPLTFKRMTKSSIISVDGVLNITVSNRVKPDRFNAKVIALLQDWYKQQAFIWFSERVNYWHKEMKVQPGQIVIGNWKTRWGYCKQNCELGFNWRLMMAPDWVADYVVVHELAHLIHLNHSSDFWSLVSDYYPQMEEAKNWLKRYQHTLDL